MTLKPKSAEAKQEQAFLIGKQVSSNTAGR
jgi:hypothetical protein